MIHPNAVSQSNLNKTILWWGRHGNYGPDYPRNRTIIQCLQDPIRRAHLCLGVFGSGEKSARVIPNKVYQSLACGRPVVTMAGDAYPDVSSYEHKGIWFCPPASPEKLGKTLSNAAASLSEDKSAGEAAYALYQQHISNDQVKNVLSNILQAARPNRMETTGETA